MNERRLLCFLTTGSLTYFVRYYCFIISLAIENSPTHIVLFLSYLHNKSLLELLAIVLNTLDLVSTTGPTYGSCVFGHSFASNHHEDTDSIKCRIPAVIQCFQWMQDD